MNDIESVSLDALKDLIDTACKDGKNQLTIATMATISQLTPDELHEALRYAATEGVELVCLPDAVEYEKDYHPHDDPVERAAAGYTPPLIPKQA